MGTRKAKEKTPLEYVLLAISIVATIFEIINLFTSGSTLFANQFAVTGLVILLLVVLSSICLIVVLKRRSANRYFYSESRRKLARYVLALSTIGFLLFGVFGYAYRPCLMTAGRIPPGKFGIVVADFTEGVNRAPTRNGKAAALDILDALTRNFYFSSLSGSVVTSHVCAVRNEQEATRAGIYSGAAMVIWGRTSEDVLKPQITLIDTPGWSANVDIREILSPVFGGDVAMPDVTPLSYRVETLTNLIVGLVYLDNAKDSMGHSLAVESFTLAIQSVYKDYGFSSCADIEDRSIKRSLAILYTVRGRGYYARNEIERAETDYLQAIACDERYSSAYIGIGNIHYGNREFLEAAANFQKALDLKSSASAYYSLANAKYYLGDYQTSIEYYKKAVEITESNGYNAADSRLLLGETYNEVGAYELAYEQFEAILKSGKASEAQKLKAQAFLNETGAWITATPTFTGTSTMFATDAIGSPTLRQATTLTLTLNASVTPTCTLRPTSTLRPESTSLPLLPTETSDLCCRHCGPDSKPCGDSCIALDATCHRPPGCTCP
jgi:tetratricopeptide (TPR) repeat protein